MIIAGLRAGRSISMTLRSTNRNRTTNQIGAIPEKGSRRKDDTVSKKNQNRESAVVSAEANNNQVVEGMTTEQLEALNGQLAAASTDVATIQTWTEVGTSTEEVPAEGQQQEQVASETVVAETPTTEQIIASLAPTADEIAAQNQAAKEEQVAAIDPNIALNLNDNATLPVADAKPVPVKATKVNKFQGAEKFDRDQICACGNWYYYKSETETENEKGEVTSSLIWVCTICGTESVRAVRPQPTSEGRATKLHADYTVMFGKLDKKLEQVGDQDLINEFHSSNNATLANLAEKPETYNRSMLNAARAEMELHLGEGWEALRKAANVKIA